jgi:hypothetical protein
MNRICWWLADLASRMLEPVERETVRGDLAESSETGERALRGVLGLVVRRQAALWRDWHPWVALFGVAGLTGVILSQIAFRLDVALGQQLRTYSRYGVHFETGLTLSQDIVYLICIASALLAWSWASGFVLGSLSGRAIWFTGALFCLVVVDWQWAQFALSGNIISRNMSLTILMRAVNTLLPFSISRLLIFLPAAMGVRRGFRRRTLGVRRALILAAAFATLTALVVWTGGWYESAHEMWSGGMWRGNPWRLRVLPLALLSWPVGYIFATARWRGQTVAN